VKLAAAPPPTVGRPPRAVGKCGEMTTITINAGFNQRILGDASRPRLPTEDGLLYNRRNHFFPVKTHDVGKTSGVCEIPDAASKAYHVDSKEPYTTSR